VRNAEWAVDSMAVMHGCFQLVWPPVKDFVVARFAEVVCSPAAVKSDGATVLTLPVNLNIAVFLTCGLTGTKLLQQTILADQIFRLCVLVLGTLHLTVDQTTEVGLLTFTALVDRAAVQGVLQRLSKVGVTWSLESFIIEDALFLG